MIQKEVVSELGDSLMILQLLRLFLFCNLMQFSEKFLQFIDHLKSACVPLLVVRCAKPFSLLMILFMYQRTNPVKIISSNVRFPIDFLIISTRSLRNMGTQRSVLVFTVVVKPFGKTLDRFQ